MKHTIRKNTFETNSSSIHTLVISRDETKIPTITMNFNVGEYGWGPDILTSCFERADYLWTYFMERYDWRYLNQETEQEEIIKNKQHLDTVIEKITNILSKYGIECDFHFPEKNTWYYIDHCYDWCDVFVRMLDDEQLLLDYLFNDGTKIYVENDNMYEEEMMKIDYPGEKYEEYVKGN